MSNGNEFSPIAQAVIDGKPAQVLALVDAALEAGRDPQAVLDEMVLAIREVGDRFGRCEFFLPDLMIGAKAMKAGVERLQPALARRDGAAGADGRKRVKVLLGTVKGDLHDIGKSLVGLMLEVNGFEVRDLGVDVPAEKILAEAERMQPDVIGLSSLLTTTAAEMRRIVEMLEKAGLRKAHFVIIGGAATTSAFAEGINADGWAENATDAVRLVNKLMSVKASAG